MREWLSGAIKKVTLELIYNIVDERTADILEKQERDKQELLGYIKRLEEMQERDKEELLGHIKALRNEFTERLNRIEDRQEKYQEETRAELRHINQRLDTLMNMLLTLFMERRKEERG